MKDCVIYNDILIMNKLFYLDDRGINEQSFYWSLPNEKRKELFYKWGLDKYSIK